MTNYKSLLITLISLLYACNSIKNKESNPEKQNIELLTDSSEMSTNNSSTRDETEPNEEDFIQAFEKQINFYKTETKENLVDFLGISKERANALSDNEFKKMIRDGNAYLYENLINELKNENAEFKLISQKDNTITVSFNEKGNDSFVVIKDFEKTNNGLVVAKKNTSNK